MNTASAGGGAVWQRLKQEMTPPGNPTLSAEASDRIRIARPLCIFFMIWVHTNPGLTEFDPARHGVRLADIYRLMFADAIGRTSIGLLAIISGYLAISTGRVFPFGPFLAKRVRSLLIPMVLWSAILLGMFLIGDRVMPGYLERQLGAPFAWPRLFNWLFGVTAHPANFPLGFLRDLFLCAVLTPVIVLLMRRVPWPTVIVLFVLMVTHAPSPFLGNNIPLFYAMGVWFALKDWSMTRFMDRFAWPIWGLFLVYGMVIVFFRIHTVLTPDPQLKAVFDGFHEVLRLFGAASFWALAGWLQKRPVGAWVAKAEPFTFFVFCSHMLFTTALWLPFKLLVGDYYSPWYPLFFAVTPVLSYAGAAVAALALDRIAHPVATLLNGGRKLPRGGKAGRGGVKKIF